MGAASKDRPEQASWRTRGQEGLRGMCRQGRVQLPAVTHLSPRCEVWDQWGVWHGRQAQGLWLNNQVRVVRWKAGGSRMRQAGCGEYGTPTRLRETQAPGVHTHIWTKPGHCEISKRVRVNGVTRLDLGPEARRGATRETQGTSKEAGEPGESALQAE